MFDFVHKNRIVVQVILALLGLPFVFWGVSSYWHGGSDVVATVEGVKITHEEFDKALRQQQERLQQMLKGQLDASMFDTPAARQNVLNQLVNEKLLAVKGRAAGLAPTNAQLFDLISHERSLQTNGKFDPEKYAIVLRNLHTTPKQMQASLSDQLAAEQLREMYVQNGYASTTAANSLIRVNEEQRVVHVAHLALDSYLKEVRVDDAAVKKFYDENPNAFRMPARARVEYIIFSPKSLLPKMTASAKEIEDYYNDNVAQFTVPEQRHALDIQITPQGSDEAAIKAAQDKAESILAQLKRAPKQFAALAKKYSDDPISAEHGGDLGFMSRTGKVPAFEDALFALKPDAISDVVRTQSGFHIIKLAGVKPQRTTPLAAVKGAIEQRIRMEKASNEFAKLNGKFYDALQDDDLKQAAALAGTQIKQSDWIERGQPDRYPWTEKAREAVFSDDVLKKHRNSSAVEIGQDTLLGARLMEYKPAGTRPLTQVASIVRAQLQRQQASELLSKRGQAMLAELQQGKKPAVKWGPEVSLSKGAPGQDQALAARVLGADVSKLPAYVGMESSRGGYDLVRVDAVKGAGEISDAKRARYEAAMRAAVGEELLTAYMADARKHASIDMKDFAAKK